jgi:hypothetical protein
MSPRERKDFPRKFPNKGKPVFFAQGNRSFGFDGSFSQLSADCSVDFHRISISILSSSSYAVENEPDPHAETRRERATASLEKGAGVAYDRKRKT